MSISAAATMWVKPARAGLIVRDPETMKQLPDDGAEVPVNSYWIRRLRDGDVVEVEARTKKLAATKNAQKAGE